MTVTAVTQGTNGSVSTSGTTVSYTPNANFNGPDSFNYTSATTAPPTAWPIPRRDTATVNVTVTEVNDAPSAGDDSATGRRGQLGHIDRRRWPMTPPARQTSPVRP